MSKVKLNFFYYTIGSALGNKLGTMGVQLKAGGLGQKIIRNKSILLHPLDIPIRYTVTAAVTTVLKSARSKAVLSPTRLKNVFS